MFTKLLLTLAAGLAVTTLANAQPVKADIPFEFSVGKSVLPPGTYEFDTSIAPGVLRVRSVDWKNGVIAITIGSAPRRGLEEAKIVFNRYADTYFLAKVVKPGESGRELLKTSREKEMAATHQVSEKLLAAK